MSRSTHGEPAGERALERTPSPRVEPTGDTLDRITVRLQQIVEETERILAGGTGSAYSIQRNVRSIQADVARLQRRHKPDVSARAAAGSIRARRGGARRG